MCLNKLFLKNKVKTENLSGFDKVWLKVPCGKCPECVDNRSKDWIFRSYFEFLKDNKPAFFVTLTYDDWHLPHYDGKPCFDYDHIVGFFARIRHYVGKFRYFLTSEYGGLTHRPHYHFVLLPEDPSLKLEDLLVEVARHWYYGQIFNIQKIDSVNGSRAKAIKYIAGYATKDMDFFDHFDEKSLFNMPNQFKPQTRASKGYGSQVELSYEDLQRGFIYLPLGQNGQNIRYSIPRYYLIRACYDYIWDRGNNKVILKKNELGAKLAIDKHNRCYVYNLKEFLSSRHLPLESRYNTWPESWPFDSRWYDVVCDCAYDFEDLKEFFYCKDFLLHFDSKDDFMLYYQDEDVRHVFVPVGVSAFVFNTLSFSFEFHPRWYFYDFCLHVFEDYKKSINSVQLKLEKQKLRDAAFKRTLYKIRRSTQLARYVHRRNIDISSLYNKSKVF